MATAASGRVAQSRPVHVFDELGVGEIAGCKLCKEQPAAYRWSEQRDGQVTQKHDVVVCRICAGMILLIGKSE